MSQLQADRTRTIEARFDTYQKNLLAFLVQISALLLKCRYKLLLTLLSKPGFDR